jgi:hypothetical protein
MANIKIDKLNGNAEDFYVGYETLNPGAMIPFHVGRRTGWAVNKDQTGLFSDSHEAQS